MKIDILMTATLRPKVVDIVLSSIRKNISGIDELCLIMNIDPIGERQCKQFDIEYIAKKHFEGSRVVFMPNRPSQGKAIQQLMYTHFSGSDYVLYWEDDYELLKPVDLLIPIKFLERQPSFGAVFFDRVGKSAKVYGAYKGKFVKINGFPSFLHRTKIGSLGGPPALMTRRYMEDVRKILDGVNCLDVLSSRPSGVALLQKWSFAVYLGEDGRGGLVRDLGSNWRKVQGLRRVKNSRSGIQWRVKG